VLLVRPRSFPLRSWVSPFPLAAAAMGAELRRRRGRPSARSRAHPPPPACP
jgi:hypothetical protein